MPDVLGPAALFGVPTRMWNWIGRRRRANASALADAPALLEPAEEVQAEEVQAEEVQAESAPQTVRLEPALDQRLERAIDETIAEIQGIRGHLSCDADRAQRFVEHLNGLPEHVAPLPEIGRESTRLLERLHEQASRTTECVESLRAGQSTTRELSVKHTALLGDQTSLLGSQTAMLAALREAIEDTTDAAIDTRAALGSLEEASSQLSAATTRLANALQKGSENASSREARMNHALARTHRWTVWAVFVSGGLGAIALVGVLLLLAR